MDARRAMFVALLLAARPTGVPAHQSSAATLTARVVPSAVNGEPLAVNLPLPDTRSVKTAILRITNRLRIPVGIEFVEDRRTQTNRELRSDRTMLTGRRLDDVLNLVIGVPNQSAGLDIGFAWQAKGAIVHVSNLHTPTFLDTPVQSFAATNATFHEILARVHAILDPQFPPPSEIGTGGSVGLGPEQSRSDLAVLDRTFSFRLDGGTVRDLLDRAILAHEEASWIVEYNDYSGTHARSDIAFSTYDGFEIQLVARSDR